MTSKICSVDDCGRRVHGRGLCNAHHTRLLRTGTVESARAVGDRSIPEQERFWAKVDASGPCWEWTAATTDGYGRFSAAGRRLVTAHRFAYETLVGDIPEGRVLDHLCRNTVCVNPDHLDPVTDRTNVVERGTGRSAANARKTHCPAGHRLDGDNLIRRRGRRAHVRDCRICANERRQVDAIRDAAELAATKRGGGA